MRTPGSEATDFRQSLTCLQIIYQTVKTGYWLVHIPATNHCGRRYNRMGGGARFVYVGSLFNTRTRAQHEFCFTSMGAIFKYT